MRKCTKCGVEDQSLFKSYDKYRCVNCQREKSQKWRENNPEKVREASLRYYHRYHDKNLAKQRKYTARVKREVFEYYGGYECKCCGETRRPFLTIDHIHGGGTKHRKEVGGGGRFTYRWIRKNNFPEGFQVLCFNCNSGRAQNNNICPHEEERNIKQP